MSTALLSIENLRTYFYTEEGVVRAVDGLSFDLQAGETLGIVGESGCGKSIACLSILRLIDKPGVIEPDSRILFHDRDLMTASEQEMRAIRGNEISMIFQEPMTSLNPVYSIGTQIAETVRAHQGATRAAARARAVEMLELVGIPDPAARVDDYPHELSGGMRQRAMIAMALACDPSILIADEPTTALDVTIQAEILELLSDLQTRLGMAMIFISHDLGVVSKVADRVLVMYAGQIVEATGTGDLFDRPEHPYTEGLLRAVPTVSHRQDRLAVIPGTVPNPKHWPDGCRFHPRCPHTWDRCRKEAPPLLGADRLCRCWLQAEPLRRGRSAPQPTATEGS